MQRRGGVWQIVRDGDCLQGQAAPQARQGPLGRRVSQVGRDSGIPLRCVLTWHIIRALHWEGQACDTMWGILSACRGERSDRPDRSFWADGSHRWVQTLAFHTKVCKHGNPSELCTEKGRNLTICEALWRLAGASGLTGETGASGQTGLTGGFRLWHSIEMCIDLAHHQRTALGRAGMWRNVRHSDCLQGRAVLQARPELLGRRVSQVGSDPGNSYQRMQAWQIIRALRIEGQESNNMWGIVAACRGERSYRRDRGLWADGSHRWVQTLAFHWDVYWPGTSSENCTGKGRHVTQCEAFRLLAGASGLTGQTGASGQTGLTGGSRLWHSIEMYFKSRADCQRIAVRRAGMWHSVRHFNCLQGRAAPQARPGPLGRRVSQVGSDSSMPLRCTS